jgi:hypothetical protein
VPGNSDDLPVPPPRRGAVRPPPHPGGEAPESVDVPRMEPPPASLEAMVQGSRRDHGERRTRWLVVGALVAGALAAISYLLR